MHDDKAKDSLVIKAPPTITIKENNDTLRHTFPDMSSLSNITVSRALDRELATLKKVGNRRAERNSYDVQVVRGSICPICARRGNSSASRNISTEVVATCTRMRPTDGLHGDNTSTACQRGNYVLLKTAESNLLAYFMSHQ